MRQLFREILWEKHEILRNLYDDLGILENFLFVNRLFNDVKTRNEKVLNIFFFRKNTNFSYLFYDKVQ